MCFSFTLKTDLIKEENSQTLTQMLETSYVLHDFTLLDSLPFSSFFSVSFSTTEWQLLFPRQAAGNHNGEACLHPPLEENKTTSKHNSLEGEIQEERRNKKEEDPDRQNKRLGEGRKKERYKV